MSKPKLAKIFKKWHRRAGIVSALFVVALSLTGILLNHTTALKLDHVGVHSNLVKALYGLPSPEIRSFTHTTDNNIAWLSFIDRTLYYNKHVIYQCDSPIVGLLPARPNWMLACANHIVSLDSGFQVIDIDSAEYGLPEGIESFGYCGNSYCMSAKQGRFRYNPAQLSWASTHQIPVIPVAIAAPDDIKAAVIAHYQGDLISWERVILDIHAGRFLGSAGPFVMDFMALLFILLALSGLYLWLKSSKKSRNREKRTQD